MLIYCCFEKMSKVFHINIREPVSHTSRFLSCLIIHTYESNFIYHNGKNWPESNNIVIKNKALPMFNAFANGCMYIWLLRGNTNSNPYWTNQWGWVTYFEVKECNVMCWWYLHLNFLGVHKYSSTHYYTKYTEPKLMINYC